jgi:polysaccharide export outer membrane protein
MDNNNILTNKLTHLVFRLHLRLHLRQGFGGSSFGGIIWLLASFLLLLSSCVSNKKFIYLQDKGNVKADSSSLITTLPYEYKLQKGDVLYISLTTEDEKLNRIFVPSAGGQMFVQQQGVSGTLLYFIGFTIDKQGEIEFPYLGKIKVSELDVDQAKGVIEVQLKKYFKVFFLQVKLAEFKFSVLGYVNRPGQYFFQQNKVTILEALSMAGDLQNLAKRTSLQLYRQYPDGIKIHSLDLTDKSLINSPFWYIQPNDVLYIEPLKVRTAGDLSSFQTSLQVITPLLTALLLVMNTYILVKSLN